MTAFYSITVALACVGDRTPPGLGSEASGAKLHRRLSARGFQSTLLAGSRATLGRLKQEIAAIAKASQVDDHVIINLSGVEMVDGASRTGMSTGISILLVDGEMLARDLGATLGQLKAQTVLVCADVRSKTASRDGAADRLATAIRDASGDAATRKAGRLSVIASVRSSVAKDAASSNDMTSMMLSILDRKVSPATDEELFASLQSELGGAAFAPAYKTTSTSPPTGSAFGAEPLELDDSDVQAHVLVGYPKHALTNLVFFKITDPASFKKAIPAARPTGAASYKTSDDPSARGLALTRAGLALLGARDLTALGEHGRTWGGKAAAQIPTPDGSDKAAATRQYKDYIPNPQDAHPAFDVGMGYRSRTILHDPLTGPGSWMQWVVRSTVAKPLHGVWVIAASTIEDLTAEEARLRGLPGMEVTIVEKGYTPADHKEHFGFTDGISTPGIAARLASRTENDARIVPSNATAVFPLDDLLVQCPRALDKSVAPRTDSVAPPSWAHNGSFLVYRRYNQNVREFEAAVKKIAAEAQTSVDDAAAQLIGRWKDGTSLEDRRSGSASPLPDDLDAFDYSSGGCPAFAHTRKVNPRTAELPTPPLFRRGALFGRATGDGDEEVGLHFMCYQSSIEHQFEAVCNWMNREDVPVADSGVDGLLGRASWQSGPLERKLGAFKLTEFVYVSGGEYFFAPSLAGLAELCGD